MINSLDSSLETEVERRCGEKVRLCYQCGKCSTGCLFNFAMDILPHQVMKLIQYGQKDRLLRSHTIWLCAACETCTARCPNDIVVAREYVMIEYDIPESMLEMACVITPGIESPTVSPLSKEGWVAVKSMSKQKDVNQIMDSLTKIGAKGIIVTDIRTCRI